MYAQMNALLELGMYLEWNKLKSQEEKKYFCIALQLKVTYHPAHCPHQAIPLSLTSSLNL
jgi:hypothetical protein